MNKPKTPLGMNDGLPIWAVFDHPSDYPDKYVARLWLTDKVTGEVLISDDLETLRMAFRRLGLVVIPAFPEDDPKLVETWI